MPEVTGIEGLGNKEFPEMTSFPLDYAGMRRTFGDPQEIMRDKVDALIDWHINLGLIKDAVGQMTQVQSVDELSNLMDEIYARAVLDLSDIYGLGLKTLSEEAPSPRSLDEILTSFLADYCPTDLQKSDLKRFSRSTITEKENNKQLIGTVMASFQSDKMYREGKWEKRKEHTQEFIDKPEYLMFGISAKGFVQMQVDVLEILRVADKNDLPAAQINELLNRNTGIFIYGENRMAELNLSHELYQNTGAYQVVYAKKGYQALYSPRLLSQSLKTESEFLVVGEDDAVGSGGTFRIVAHTLNQAGVDLRKFAFAADSNSYILHKDHPSIQKAFRDRIDMLNAKLDDPKIVVFDRADVEAEIADLTIMMTENSQTWYNKGNLNESIKL